MIGIEDWSESRRGLSVDLSPVLANLRIRMGMTQLELAMQVGVSGAAVGHWECCGHPVSARYVPLLAIVLRVTVDELTHGMTWRRMRRVLRPEVLPDESVQQRLYGAGMTSERGPRDVIGTCLQCGQEYPIEDRRPRLRRCGRCHGQVLVEAA